MTRTRLRQLEQIRCSNSYDDQLNQGDFSSASSEGQPSGAIGSGDIAGDFTISTIVVEGDFTLLGANIDDEIVVSGSTSNDGTHRITGISYTLPNTTFTVAFVLTPETGAGTAAIFIDSLKNLQRDLDAIRTQLRKLNKTDNWYDDPKSPPVVKYQLITGTDYAANSTIALANSETYDAGEPYTLKVYLNGQLLLPSIVSGNAVTTWHDYAEKFDSGYVGLNETGNSIEFSFDIQTVDLIQLKWTKK